MDEQSLQTLLFLAMLVGWAALSFLEAQARKRQQRRRLEEMEREEELEGDASAPWQVEEGEPRGWIPPEEYDLWQEEPAEPWEPERPEAPAPAPRPLPEPAAPREPAPPSAGRRPQPRDLPPPGGLVTAGADLPPTELALEAERLREEGRRELRERPGTAIGAVEELDGEGAARKPGARRATAVAPAVRGRRPASPAAGALRRALRGDRQALREAVLYREVLGRPLGSRPRPGGWEESAG